MRMRVVGWGVVALSVFLFAWASRAEPQEALKKATTGVAGTPQAGLATKSEPSFKGVFEAAHMAEISLHPEAAGEVRGGLTVQSGVEHGSRVSKGDVLLTLDSEKLDLAIRDADKDVRLSALALTLAEDEAPVLEKMLPLDLAAAERAKRQADEDYRKFVDVDRPQSIRNAEFAVKSAANQLDYAREELRQLEKMYRSGDIREETEEIILKRQRNMVEAATLALQNAQTRKDQTLKVDLPRQEQTLHETMQKQALTFDKARTALPLTLHQKKLTLEKARAEQAKAADRLRKLQADRAHMTIKAPFDGVLYYGRCTRGQWTVQALIAPKLQKGGTLLPDEVFMTVVQTRPLFVRATVDEKDLAHVKRGALVTVVPAALPDMKLSGRVAQVLGVPLSAGSFEAKISIEPGPDAELLVPGMTCTVSLGTPKSEGAKP